MRTTARRHPAGPPAATVRPDPGGVGRSSSAAAERVSDDLRRGAGDFLEQRRRIAGLTSLASFALGVVGLYQFGLLRRVPEPPLPFLDADAVDAAGEAYQQFRTPDAALGLLSAGVTLALAGMGDRDRARTAPWVPLALAAKTAADAGGGIYLFAEQVTKHRKVCSWCTVAAAAQLATLPLALPEARAALRRLVGRS
ncbi:Vitamin K epoxide reductase family protein [Blastococcus sp. DSM 46786]|uniref:vitamin K epoxide reductase family protein n=1 Tax=Blastococcus sp. DSM 46786 TaxID=1798227 RepID=UPI0008CE0251|nr:vitamin K epoxide reductase family protein [Blastococcus sp. DSM 46786]SEL13029.1 Vitamin K epoxide reductase family protein [Blastococcus sp. DSM 46786]